MTARLPTPGHDEGQWGEILNDYLSQAHAADGSIKDMSITKPKLETTVQSSLAKADTALQSVTKADVGLGNVDNTSDANKPVSTAQSTADNLRILKAGDTMMGDLSIGVPTDSAELITNQVDRDFSGPTNWAGTNWALFGGALKHTTGSAANATLNNSFLTAGSITTLTTYKITITVSGMTAGTLTAFIGAGFGGAISTNGTYSSYFLSSSANQNMSLAPTSTFDGSVQSISLIRIAQPIYLNASNSNFGVGTGTPQKRFVIQADHDSSLTAMAIYNRSTFNNNAAVLSFRSDTSGAGATTFLELAAIRVLYEQHDHATRAASFGFFTTNSGAETERLRVGSDGKIGINTIAPNEILDIRGNLALGVAGNGIKIKEGANATMGVATFVGGTVTVSTTKVTATSRIILTVQSLGTITIPAAVAVTARTPGASFVITSAAGTDTSVVAWLLIEPAA